LNGEFVGTAITSYSLVSRAIGVVCSSETGDLLSAMPPTMMAPMKISASSLP